MRVGKPLLTIALLFFTLLLGWQLGSSAERRKLTSEHNRLQDLFTISGSGSTVLKDPEEEVDITILWSVWRLLLTHYLNIDELDTQKMVYGAVAGMVEAVGDPYTVFMTPKDTQAFADIIDGNLEGIGAQLESRDGLITVVAPLKGSPAAKAGLLPNDVIVEVDGTEVTNTDLDDAVALIRGPKETSVTLSVLRPDTDAPVSITIVRETVHIPTVESEVKETQTGSVAVISLNQFGSDSTPELTKALEALDQKSLKGIVLDLRFNGGGILEGAVELTSMFVKDGKVVTVVQRDRPPETHFVSGNPIVPDLPLVVLINGGSASASEIAAGALLDLKRATLIGTQSYGKGTVQQIIELPGGAGLRVTIAKWLTPSGHDLGKKGIEPDIVVERSPEQYRADIDPQLATAIEWLTDKQDISASFRQSGSGSKL